MRYYAVVNPCPMLKPKVVEMKLFKVHIYINLEKWGEYEIIAPDRDSAAFVAGMKYKQDENTYPGDYITCVVIPDPSGKIV